MTMFHGAHKLSQQVEAVIAGLKAENAELRRENEHLRSETKRLGGGNAAPGVQMRKCIKCRRDLPDGPSFYPGYLEPESANSAVEAKRYDCVYCR